MVLPLARVLPAMFVAPTLPGVVPIAIPAPPRPDSASAWRVNAANATMKKRLATVEGVYLRVLMGITWPIHWTGQPTGVSGLYHVWKRCMQGGQPGIVKTRFS